MLAVVDILLGILTFYISGLVNQFCAAKRTKDTVGRRCGIMFGFNYFFGPWILNFFIPRCLTRYNFLPIPSSHLALLTIQMKRVPIAAGKS